MPAYYLHMPRGGEDGVIIVDCPAMGRRVEFRGRPYSQWDLDEDSPFYRLHAQLRMVNISELHNGEVQMCGRNHPEYPYLVKVFQEALLEIA